MSFSNALEGEILDWVFSIVTGSPNEPTQGTHLGCLTVIDEVGPPETYTEAANIDRVDVATTPLFSRTDDQVWNNATITFTNDDAAQQTIVGIALYDADTAGNVVAWAALQTSRDVPSAADLEFAADGMQTGASITFTLD